MAEASEIDFWRAAGEILEQFASDSELEAADRADRAYEQGDMTAFRPWAIVTDATGAFLRRKPLTLN
jgi:hypothetical protein